MSRRLGAPRAVYGAGAAGTSSQPSRSARVRELGAARQAEALEEAPEVRLHRLRGDPEPRRDLVVREAVDDCRHDVALARGEARPGRPGSHAEREPTGGRGADRVEQLRDGGGLQHVASRAEAQRGVDVLRDSRTR